MLRNFFLFQITALEYVSKEKELIAELDMDWEISPEYMFYGNEKTIQWAKITLDGVDWNVKEKVLRCLK